MYLVVLPIFGGQGVVLAPVLRQLRGVVLTQHFHQLDHRAGGALDHRAAVRRAERRSEHSSTIEADVPHSVAQALAHDLFVSP